MEKDIFGDDPKFGDNKEKPDTSFGEGVGDIIKGFMHLFKGIARIFLKKFNINLLVLLILLFAVFFGAWYFLKKEISEPALSDIKCPEALLFSSGGKVDVKEISSQCRISQEEAEKALTESKKRYEEDNSNLKIVNEENLWEITCPEPEPCPELNCSSCPVKTETKIETQTLTKYQCWDGSIKDSPTITALKILELYLEKNPSTKEL